ncbi:MAG: iron-containing redox enzyme family protein [Acidimicrobiales bacterium]
MRPSRIDASVDSVLQGRRLLTHPFYRRWEAGRVSKPELASYAAQYRHFEQYLPHFLAELASALPDGPARTLVQANLGDELGDPIPHTALFEEFATAVGATVQEASPAMAQLLATYDEMLDMDPQSALAGFLAYEMQAAEVASNKAKTLRQHYGIDGRGSAFWDHHARVDVEHRQWMRDALALSTSDTHEIEESLRNAADAWWAFLDEREEFATAA